MSANTEEPLTSEQRMLNLMWANLETCDGNPADIAMAIDMLLEQSGGEETDMVRFLQWILRNNKWPDRHGSGWWEWHRAKMDPELEWRSFLPYEFFWCYPRSGGPFDLPIAIDDSKSKDFPTVMHFLYVALVKLEFRDADTYAG